MKLIIALIGAILALMACFESADAQQGIYHFNFRGNNCLVNQQCSNVANHYSWDFEGFPTTDFNGSQLVMAIIFNSQNGGNTGTNGAQVPIDAHGHGTLNFDLSGNVSMWMFSPEDCCSPFSAADFAFGQVNPDPCVNLPIQWQWGKLIAGNTMLEWKVGVETNVKQYTVQGYDTAWHDLGVVMPTGPNSTYTFRLAPQQAGLGWIYGCLALLCLSRFIGRGNKSMAVIGLLFALGACQKDLSKPAVKPLSYYRIHEQDNGAYNWYSPVIQVQ